MLTLENSTDQEAYAALKDFNRLVLQYRTPIFSSPTTTNAASFHGDLLLGFDIICDEIRKHSAWGMPMARLDTVQYAMLQGSDKWRVAWVKAFGEPIDNPFENLSMVVNAHPEILSLMVSRMLPGTVLPRHQGPFRGVMRYHLGVTIPEGDCALQVDDQEYKWKEGVGVCFDDTLWHSAWNRTPSDRVVLFADVLRPLSGTVAARRDALIEQLKNSKALTDIRETIRREAK